MNIPAYLGSIPVTIIDFIVIHNTVKAVCIVNAHGEGVIQIHSLSRLTILDLEYIPSRVI